MNIEKASIWEVLSEAERRRAVFVKPSPGKGLTALHETATGVSPATIVMAVRELALVSSQAIPFHAHRNKEKVYAFGGGGIVVVLMYRGDELVRSALVRKGQTIAIPPGTVHAVVCVDVDDECEACKILIVSSSKDGNDIAWEPATDELLKNEHLQE